MQSTYDHVQYYAISKTRKEALISKIKAILQNEKQITLAWIFGSFTRRDSVRDLDLAIYSNPKMAFKEYLSLNAQIELELGIPVDMVEIRDTPQSLKENILASGILIKGTKQLQTQLQKAI